MAEHDVLIPIKFTVEDSNDVHKFIEDLKKKLNSTKDIMKSSSGKGLDNSAEIQRSIDALDGYIRKIEDARAKILDMQHQMEAAKESLEINKNEKPFQIGDFKVTQSDIDRAVADAQKAYNDERQRYLEQAPAYLRDLKESATLANAMSARLDELTASTEKSTEEVAKAAPKVDLFKQALQDYKDSFNKSFNESFGLKEIEDMIDRISQAVSIAQNAVEGTYRTLAGDKVKVDPGATKELLEQFEIVDAYGAKLDEMITHYENFRNMILDRSITKELAVEKETVSDFRTQLDILNKDVMAAIQILTQEVSVYEHEARIAAQSVKELKGNVVTESRPREEVGHAEVVIEETKAKQQAEQERLETIRQLEEEERQFAEIEKAVAKTTAEIIKEVTNEYKEQERIEKERVKAHEDAIKAQIRNLNQEISAVKQSAAQYYYKLRSVKMLGFALTSMTNTVKKFGKTTISATSKALRAYLNLIPGVKALKRAIDGTHNSQKRFNKELSASNKHSKTYNGNLKNLLAFILKYGLGIRSIYIAWRKLRQAVSDGLESMAKQFESVNSRMSSIVSSLNYMKASVTSVVQPLLNLLAPALEKISALFSEVTYKIASFIAALTGQSTVMKAIRVETDYAASLDKTAKSAKDATKELGKYDKLNVIHKDKDSGNEDFGGMGWEEVPIDSTFADWAQKFKDFLNRLLAPIKAAWEKIKGYLLKSFNFMVEKLKALWASIAESFWRVWEELDTQRIFENILIIAANIMQIIGIIADKLREAWEHNDNGYRILAAIRDVILIISEKIKEASFYTIEWAKNLTFTPLFDAIADNLENRVVPAVEKVMELLKIVYEQIILKIVKDFIEKGLPQIVDLAGKVAEIIGIIAEKIRIGLQSGSNGILIVDRAEKLLQIVMDKIQECADKTKEWAEELDFRPLFSSIKTFLEDIEPLVKTVSDTLGNFYTNVLLPFWKYLIEGKEGENGEREGGIPGALKTIGEAIKQIDWEAVTENMNKLMEALEPFFELAWEVITQLVADFIAKFGEFAASEDIGKIIDKFKDWVTNADPEELASKLEKFAGVLAGVTGALSLLSGVILPLMVNIMTLRNFATQGMMVKTVQSLEKDVAKLAGTGTGEGATGLAGLSGKFKGLLMNLDAVNPSLITIGTTIAGIAAIAVGGITAIASFSDMMQNGFSAASEVAMLLGIALAAVGAVILGAPALVAGVVAAIVALVANFVIAIQTMPEELAQMFNKFGEFMGSLPQKFEEFFDGLISKVKDFGHNLGVKVGEFIATAPQKFEEWRQNLLVFIENVDWMELGINIVKGILAIFYLPVRLLAFIIEAIGEFVKSFIEGIEEGFDMHSPSKKMEPFGENILKGILEGIISALKGIGTWIVTNIFEPIMSGIKTAFGIVNGIANTFKDIGGNLINGLKEGITSTWDKAKGKVSEVWNAVTKSAEDTYEVSSPSKVFDTIGSFLMGGLKKGIVDSTMTLLNAMTDLLNSLLKSVTNLLNDDTLVKTGLALIEGLINGISDRWKVLISNVTDSITKLLSKFKDKLTTSALTSPGTKLITGLLNAMKTVWRDVFSATLESIRDLIKSFKDGLTPSTLVQIAKDWIGGLLSGLSEGFNKVKSTISEFCYDVTETVKDIFQIHSPSKVFEEIGLLLTEGLALGIAENTSDVTDSLENVIPSDMTDSFYDSFIDGLLDMKSEAIEIITSMSDEMDKVMSNLSFLSMSANLNSISKIKIPDIALGYSLPSNADFKQTKQEVDLSKLPEIIKEAFVEALNEADTNSDNRPIMLQLNSRTIAQAVWDEESKRDKQRGDYKPLYTR